jgi:predicted acylesterase/phospholipase RssA
MNSRTIGLCFSGGGHRASIFSLGALLYLVDAGRHRDVSVISSVSGGSLTSGFLAIQEKPLTDQNREELDACAARWAWQIAGSRPWWWIAMVGHGALLVGSILLMVWSAWPRWGIVIGYLAAVALWARAVGHLPRGTFWGWWGTWLYVAIAAPAALLLLFVTEQAPAYFVYFAVLLSCIRFSHSLPSNTFFNGCRILGLVALIAGFPGVVYRQDPKSWPWHITAVVLATLVLSQRSRVADLAFRATICKGKRLRGIHPVPQHIFCSTEMETVTHAYFSRDFIYSRDAGLGEPADLHLSTALEASANFPVAFPYRTFRLAGHKFALGGSLRFAGSLFPSMALSDGGVYDNTGVAWFMDSAERKASLRRSLELDIAIHKFDLSSDAVHQRIKGQLAGMEHDAELQIIFNSSYPHGWHSSRLRSIPGWGEIAALVGIEDAIYESRGREQCRDLHRHFWLKSRKGALVSIEQNPERLPMVFRNLEQRRHSLDATVRGHEWEARRILDETLRELGVPDVPDALLEQYCQLAEAVRDRAVFGPEYKTVLSAAANRYRELDEQLRELRQQRERAPSLSVEEAKLEMDINKRESEQWGIFNALEKKRSNWDWDPARREEIEREVDETQRCWKVPTRFDRSAQRLPQNCSDMVT